MNRHSSKRSNTMGYQKSPTSSSNNYKKNVVVGGAGSYGGSSALSSSSYRKNNATFGGFGSSRGYVGSKSIDLTFPCESYGALLWHAETLRRATDALDKSYTICCSRGKVKLGTELLEPPKLLKDLIIKEHNKSTLFIENIRRYNSMFSFTSMGEKVDNTVNYGHDPFCYRFHDENYHRVGTVVKPVVSEYYNSRLTKRERKPTIADELLADQAYRKRKVQEIEAKSQLGRVGKWKIKGKSSWKHAKLRSFA
nr:rRNA-processing protein FCF2-like [Tanacetum cinerariifolium]